MISTLYILIAVAVLIYIFKPLFAKQDSMTRATRRESRRQQLLEDRESVYEAIRELDFDHRMGKVEDDDYQETRGRFQARAVDVLKALDDMDGRLDHLESDVEKEIAALRKKKRRPPAPSHCTQCEASLPPDARFCPRCGEVVSA